MFAKNKKELTETFEKLVKDELRVDEILEPGLTMIRLTDLVQNCYKSKLPDLAANLNYNIRLVQQANQQLKEDFQKLIEDNKTKPNQADVLKSNAEQRAITTALQDKLLQNQTQIVQLDSKLQEIIQRITQMESKQTEIESLNRSQRNEHGTFQRLITQKLDKNLELMENTG